MAHPSAVFMLVFEYCSFGFNDVFLFVLVLMLLKMCFNMCVVNTLVAAVAPTREERQGVNFINKISIAVGCSFILDGGLLIFGGIFLLKETPH